MRKIQWVVAGAMLAVLVLVAGVSNGEAQTTASWQLSPLCNVLTLVITGEETPFTVTGFIDTCGGDTFFPAFGTALNIPDGSFAVGLTAVFPGGGSTSMFLALDPESFVGTWATPDGQSGSLLPQ